MCLTELSPAENRIAREVAKGFSEKEIADRLCLSAATVHNHTYKIRKKLNARSAVDICRIFILSLEHPKQFMLCLRTGVRTVRAARSGKRKNEFQYA